MSEPSPLLMAYIRGAGDTSARARRVLALIVSFSLVTFAAYWNATSSFATERLRSLENWQYWAARLQNRACPARLTPADSVSCQRAAQLDRRLRERDPRVTDAQLNAIVALDVKALLDERASTFRTVGVPGFAIKFDIGDLWLIAQLTFLILLVWLIFAMTCDLRDVRETLQLARKEGCLAPAQQLLAMQRVLSVPPQTFMARQRFWRSLPKVFFLAPLAVQVFGGLTGRWYQSDWAFDVPRAASLGFLAVSLLASLVLTYHAITIAGQIDHEWLHGAEPSSRPHESPGALREGDEQ